MQRLKRIFAIDIENCSDCGGRLWVIAYSNESEAIRQIQALACPRMVSSVSPERMLDPRFLVEDLHPAATRDPAVREAVHHRPGYLRALQITRLTPQCVGSMLELSNADIFTGTDQRPPAHPGSRNMAWNVPASGPQGRLAC